MNNPQTDIVNHAMQTILVVDDMEANRAVLARRLEKFGYNVVCVDSGVAAMAHVAQSIPDIILLDYMMPQMSGIEVLHELRSDLATREVPVIMVTARAESEATIEALEAGADDYVTKPIDFDVLRARIETQLAKRTDACHLRRANAVLDERVTLRSMALADLESELQEEVRRRRDLEEQIAQQSQTGSDLPTVSRLLEDMDAKFEAIFMAVAGGKSVNLAQMAEFKSMITRARNALAA